MTKRWLVAFALVLVAPAEMMAAPRPSPLPAPASVVADAANPMQPRPKREHTTFPGRITQSASGKYVLHDTSTNSTFQLDNQQEAKMFAGRAVKVIGTLDPTSTVIHVIDIEAV